MLHVHLYSTVQCTVHWPGKLLAFCPDIELSSELVPGAGSGRAKTQTKQPQPQDTGPGEPHSDN